MQCPRPVDQSYIEETKTANAIIQHAVHTQLLTTYKIAGKFIENTFNNNPSSFESTTLILGPHYIHRDTHRKLNLLTHIN